MSWIDAFKIYFSFFVDLYEAFFEDFLDEDFFEEDLLAFLAAFLDPVVFLDPEDFLADFFADFFADLVADFLADFLADFFVDFFEDFADY